MALTDIKVSSAKPETKSSNLLMAGYAPAVNLTAQSTGDFSTVLAANKIWRWVFILVLSGEASRKRDEAKKLVADGIDPREEKS
jgi:hypothetical protein